MNQRGYSWPETILTLAVLVVIFGTLLPLATKITSGLYDKKLTMHAAETAYHGTIIYRAYAVNEGTRNIEGITYDWRIAGSSICISYKPDGEAMVKCIDFRRN